MGNEKLKRKEFLKNLAGLAVTEPEVLTDGPPSEPDPLFKKYARKALGPRRYSQQMGNPDPGGPVLLDRVGNVTSGLTPYAGAWTIWEAAHLLRRVGFGVKKAELEALLALTPSAAVDAMLVLSAPANPSPTPLNHYNNSAIDSSGILLGDSWTSTNLTYAGGSNDGTVNSHRQNSLVDWSWGLCINEPTTIREKMTLFWYHFIPVNFDDVRGMQNNSSTMCNDYMSLLRTNALGNFKTLIKAIAKTPAMLVFLSNQYSTAAVPNENFARELMELFTLGKVPTQNYTEPDIIAASKVFSGWRVPSFVAAYPFAPGFNSAYHNQTNKVFSQFFGPNPTNTIVNQAGAAGANEFDIFFDMLFTYQQDTIAKYICRRLYRYFVYYDIDANVEANVIVPLAAFLVSSNWEMAPVVSKLLKSEHFFDVANKGVMIKSPIDFITGTLRTLNINTTAVATTNPQIVNQYTVWQYFHNYANSNLEQGYGLVPNVSGWKAYYQEPMFYQNWINSYSIQKRASLLTSFINGFTSGGLSIKIDAIAWVQQWPNATIQDPDLLIDIIIQYLLPVDLPANYKTDTKVQTLLAGQVTNSYWTTAWNNYIANPTTANTNTVKTRLNSLLTTLLQLAEYQLM
ncbi:MAG TPA: DUF1800 family protein [Ferruginibacter sp.]|nr:DUF1800 family protein [Ferruginibacter sp.]